MLNVLPQTLPEAYDQALGRIQDTRYGSKMFQFIAASYRPLHVEELRVALNVVPGSTSWNSATFPQSNAFELVGLCGGTLLEVDEETHCVHFIHHSAALHLLSNSSSTHINRFHFTASEADLTAGGTCVTYLNFGEFDRRLTFRARNDLVIKRLTDEVDRSLVLNASMISRILLLFRPQSRQPNSIGVDISRTLRALAPQTSEKGVRQFLGYARTYCVFHTKNFHSEHTPKGLYALWLRILSNGSERINLPWQCRHHRRRHIMGLEQRTRRCPVGLTGYHCGNSSHKRPLRIVGEVLCRLLLAARTVGQLACSLSTLRIFIRRESSTSGQLASSKRG